MNKKKREISTNVVIKSKIIKQYSICGIQMLPTILTRSNREPDKRDEKKVCFYR